MGAVAYARGDQVAFAESPSLHTAAHEAAHVVQQRAGVQLKGDVGQAGDAYERHADAVADAVVKGQSAEGLLAEMAPNRHSAGGAVQAKPVQLESKADTGRGREGGTAALPLAASIERALGKHATEDDVLHLIRHASLVDAVALAGNEIFLVRLEAGHSWRSVRPQLAHRIFPGGGSADDAFKALTTSDDKLLERRLAAYGNPALQKMLLNTVIAEGVSAVHVRRAFYAYWHVHIASVPAVQDVGTAGPAGSAANSPTPAEAARDWPIAKLQAIHRQMQRDRDTHAVTSSTASSSDPGA